MRLLEQLDQLGNAFAINPAQRRYVQIANRVSFLFFVLVLLIGLVAYAYFGWFATTRLAMVTAALFLLFPLLNRLGYTNSSRLLLIVLIATAPTSISIVDKFDHPEALEEFEYFAFRIIALAASILPFILFSIKEKRNLFFGLALTLIILLLYDPLHNWFGAGFYQMGFTSPHYYFINYIFVFAYLIVIGATYFLKRSFEKSEEENHKLIQQLSNRQLELMKSSELLQQHRKRLTLEKRDLNKEIIEKNNQLTETNKELIRHNNELQQFSYTISHNLKGPVASLKGLLSLVDPSGIGGENKEIMARLKQSTIMLDNTIKDLNNIIDLRNDISRVRQEIKLQDLVDRIVILLKKDIVDHHISIETDFSAQGKIYGVSPMLESILYNLISNGIKYRSTDHKPVIRVASSQQDKTTTISVSDNGLGIDMEKFGDQLFGLYKRFHLHTEGKGLGLYLVKLQTEAMDGSIEVASKPGEGTQFTLTFKVPQNLDEQILYHDENATLYFNAPLNCVGIDWKRDAGFEISREILLKAFDFVKNYNTPNWISNINQVGTRNEERLNALRREKKEELKKAGLKRIAVVCHLNNENLLHDKGFNNVYLADVRHFHLMKDARDWIRRENENEKTT